MLLSIKHTRQKSTPTIAMLQTNIIKDLCAKHVRHVDHRLESASLNGYIEVL